MQTVQTRQPVSRHLQCSSCIVLRKWSPSFFNPRRTGQCQGERWTNQDVHFIVTTVACVRRTRRPGSTDRCQREKSPGTVPQPNPLTASSRTQRRTRCHLPQEETFLKIFESDTRVPETLARHRAHNPVRTAVQQQLQKTLELKTQTHRSRGNVAPPEGPFSPQTLVRVHHPERRAGSGVAPGGPGHVQTLTTTIPVCGATPTERGHS